MKPFIATPENQALFDALEAHNIKRWDDDLPLYKYVTADTAKIILNSHSLKFSSPGELKDNDMEMTLLNLNFPESYIQKRKPEIFLIAAKNKHNLVNRKQIRDYLRSKDYQFEYAQFTDDFFKRSYTEFMFNPPIGIFCSTTSNKNGMMWNKFAASETGFCIEYYFPSLFTEAHYGFLVNYDDEMKSFNYFDANNQIDNIAFHRWVFTKRKQYIDEQEVRIVTKFGANGIVPYPLQFFTGVYATNHTSQNDIREIEDILMKVGYSFDKVIVI